MSTSIADRARAGISYSMTCLGLAVGILISAGPAAAQAQQFYDFWYAELERTPNNEKAISERTDALPTTLVVEAKSKSPEFTQKGTITIKGLPATLQIGRKENVLVTFKGEFGLPEGAKFETVSLKAGAFGTPAEKALKPLDPPKTYYLELEIPFHDLDIAHFDRRGIALDPTRPNKITFFRVLKVGCSFLVGAYSSSSEILIYYNLREE